MYEGPTVGNCIGEANHKFFILFVIYSVGDHVAASFFTFLCLYHSVSVLFAHFFLFVCLFLFVCIIQVVLSIFTVSVVGPFAPVFGGAGSVALSVLSIMCIVVSVTQGGFAGWHLYLVARDFTTLEFIMFQNRIDPVRDGDVPKKLYIARVADGNFCLLGWSAGAQGIGCEFLSPVWTACVDMAASHPRSHLHVAVCG